MSDPDRCKAALSTLIDAASEANDAMRLFNRGGMKWMEYDGIFARLDRVLREAREALAPLEGGVA